MSGGSRRNLGGNGGNTGGIGQVGYTFNQGGLGENQSGIGNINQGGVGDDEFKAGVEQAVAVYGAPVGFGVDADTGFSNFDSTFESLGTYARNARELKVESADNTAEHNSKIDLESSEVAYTE